MNKLKFGILKSFLLALFVTICFPAGIVGTIMGATHDMGWMLGVGIAMTVVGFYGLPFVWIGFSNKVQLKPVLRTILVEEILTVSELSEQLSKKPKEIEQNINALIVGGYLVGYKFSNGKLVKNVKDKQTKSLRKSCPTCGALMKLDGNSYVCGYCGNVVSNN